MEEHNGATARYRRTIGGMHRALDLAVDADFDVDGRVKMLINSYVEFVQIDKFSWLNIVRRVGRSFYFILIQFNLN